MSASKLEQSLRNLEKAVQRLREALDEPRSNALAVDGAKAAHIVYTDVSEEDQKLAEEIGIEDPGEYSFLSPQLVMRDLAQLIMFGIPPFYGDLRIAKPVCYIAMSDFMKYG